MTRNRIGLLIFLLLISPMSKAQLRPLHKKNHSVNEQLKNIINFPDFKTAGIAFLAVDLQTQEIISQHQPDLALKPASTLKLFTTASALELLHPNYKFQTLLEYTGTLDTNSHVLHGNIIIKGGGDPTLGSVHFEQTKMHIFLNLWLEAFKKLGIDSISGGIIGDASLYHPDPIPKTWSWINLGNYFGAGACGLTIYDNTYTIHFTTGNSTGDTAKINEIVPYIPDLVLESTVMADSINYDNTNIFGAPFQNKRIVRGTLPLKRTDFQVKGAVPDPAYLAAYELHRILSDNGIKINTAPTTLRQMQANIHPQGQSTTFDTIYSPPLSEIIKQTNTKSINLYAEHCLLQLAQEAGTIPFTDSAAQVLKRFWKAQGMDIQGLRIADGSGLSHYNALTPRQMVYLLSYLKNSSPHFDVFYESLPHKNNPGTLKNYYEQNPEIKTVRAKSGTVDGCKAFAGYVKSKSGREIAFCVIANNFSCPGRQASIELEKLMTALENFDK
ncbi:MAG: D-alanyl-D-alanine carboxypeptidase/D-alanyl-D-alanine-endopeptidase [Bacteroidetes bacterium HGW-Bacteroidetes-4]|jgi:D-alanyl-D-alanine carboxypeptidase/D-alanyl-D-alanine-endopeptidase (penicillin-binding protein 4)|nr:MAG: D-alanyl-D-alanine carboxypeptidase/D-alanyl-D-alanine-endopeptidase [Bacteroidetes bacterium HGW-Bacteroidetes-4]